MKKTFIGNYRKHEMLETFKKTMHYLKPVEKRKKQNSERT